jgi:carboxyl-terminal processing protease
MKFEKLWQIVTPVLATIIALVFFFTVPQGGVSGAGSDDTYEKLKIFTSVLNEIEQKYVDEEKPDKLIYGAIQGMVRILDPHSAFLPPEEYKELRIETKGEFGGIGIEITIRDGVLTVVSPIEDTPAFRAGMKAGDKIIKIDGKITKDMSLTDAVKLIRGLKGREVVLTVLREGEPRLITVPIVRDIIRVQSVKWKTIGEDIAYIRILAFQDRTYDKLADALNDLKVDEKLYNGLVLDLRNNPGGLLDQAVKVSDAFLSEGVIVYTKGRVQNQNVHFYADKEILVPKHLPVVVLVNQGSASASEIVAGALQDHKRAIIMGTSTFGKGSVQTIIPLDDDSGLRLTTALYYTPGDRSIQAKGITPDVLVELIRKPPEQDDQKKRMFIREKDLLRHLENSTETEQPAEGTPEEETGSDLTEDETPPEPGPEEEDNQLSRAVELLRAWNIFSKLESRPHE